MTNILIVTSNAETTTSVAAVLSELDGFSEPLVLGSAAQARLELQKHDIDIILVDQSVQNGEGIAVVREIAALEPLIPVCLLTPYDDADSVLKAVDAGARAILPLPPSVERYAERLRSLSAWARAASGQVASEREALNRTVGRMVVVLGAKGGVGTSLLALLSAAGPAARGRTALLDFDLRQGDLGSYCGIRVRHSVVDLVSVAAEIGNRELSEVAYPVRSGIELFPAPEHSEIGEDVTEAASRQILQAMRYQYEYIIVDGGSYIDEATAAALDLADVIVVVATPDVPALRAVRRLKETMERLGLAQSTPIHVVLNRTSRHNEIQPAGAAKLVDSPLLGNLPENGPRLEPAINAGQLLDADYPELLSISRAVGALLYPSSPSMSASEFNGATTPMATPHSMSSRRDSSKRKEKRRRFTRKRAATVEEASTRTSDHQAVRTPPVRAEVQSNMSASSGNRTLASAGAAAVPEGAQAPELSHLPSTPAPLPPSLPPRNTNGVPQASQIPAQRRSSTTGRTPSSPGQARPHEHGATAVEFAGIFVIAAGFIMLCLELLLFGGVSLVAHNSAQEAARNYAVGMSDRQVEQAVAKRLPDGWASRMSIDAVHDDEVKVSIDAPGLMPGLRPAQATARITWEK